jgi:hypothetical protein
MNEPTAPRAPRVSYPLPLPDLELAKKSPRGRTIESVAAIVCDVEALGAAAAGRRHRMSTSGVTAIADKWRRHPTVIAALEVARPRIEARTQAAVDRMHEGVMDAVRKALGR